MNHPVITFEETADVQERQRPKKKNGHCGDEKGGYDLVFNFHQRRIDGLKTDNRRGGETARGKCVASHERMRGPIWPDDADTFASGHQLCSTVRECSTAQLPC